MKGIYQIFLFLMIYQMTSFIVGTLNIFPVALYSDIDFATMPSNSNWLDYVTYFFGAGYGDFTVSLAILGISGVLVGLTTIASILQGSVVPIMMGVFGAMALHMIGTSKQFFDTLLTHGGPSIIYLGLCFFVAIGAMVLFAIIEMPMGGDSG
jgi:hypothetical protein